MTNVSPKIVLTGVTGKLGSLVLAQLLKSVPLSDIGISARDPSKLAHLISAGHRVLPGSYDDAASLAKSLSGADIALIISSNDRTGKGQAHHSTAISACQSAGVRKVYYTSHQAAAERSAFWPAADHYATEQMLDKSGLEWVSLRDGFHMDAVKMFLGSAGSGEVVAPKDGKVSWTAHSDLAEAAARLIQGDYTGKPLDVGKKVGDKGRIVTLANTKALDLADIVQVFSQVEGKEVKRVTKEWADYRKAAIERGMPEGIVDMMKGFYETAAAGEFESKDETLRELLGREPVTVKEMLEDK